MSVAAEPRTLLLDDVAGWRAARHESVVRADADGAWALHPLPGPAPEDAHWPGSLAEQFPCPSGVTSDACDRVLIVDAARHEAAQIDVSDWSIRRFRLSGTGREPRRLDRPRGIARLADGSIAVADTGNHRVQIFSPPMWTLTGLYGATGPTGRPLPGDGALEFRHPWTVESDGCGGIHVVDRGNGRIQTIGWNRSPVETLGASVLEDPVDLALSSDGLRAVADPARGGVELFDPDGAWIGRGSASPSDGPSVPVTGGAHSVAFGADGRLYAGDDRGRIHVWWRGDESDGWVRIDDAITGLDGPVTGLDVLPDGSLVALIARLGGGSAGRDEITLWRLEPDGMFKGPGAVWTEPLDSRIEGCKWHRIELDAEIPPGTHVDVATYTDEEVRLPSDDLFEPGRVRLGPGDRDVLVRSPPGRYLWLRIGLGTDGLSAPVVRAAKIHFPRIGYLRHLPAVFQEDEESRDFLERFLAIFQTSFDDLGATVDRMWELFDPAAVEEEHLGWLAGWLDVRGSPDWSPGHAREMIRDAWLDHTRRGTAAGLSKAIRDYAGSDARIVEHYRLRRWPRLSFGGRLEDAPRLWSRDFYRRLQLDRHSRLGSTRLLDRPPPALEPLDWGAHVFSVLFAADPRSVDRSRTRVAAVVEREKPAHTKARLHPVYPRLRVGVQSTVGVDARVGQATPLALNRLATLGYDSILSCPTEEQSLRRYGTSSRPRAGVTTRLR